MTDTNIFSTSHANFQAKSSPSANLKRLQQSIERFQQPVARRSKPKSLKVRPENLAKLETEIRKILSAIRHGGIGITVLRPKELNQQNYHYKARNLLAATGLITFTPGYYDRMHKDNSKAAIYHPTEKLKHSLAYWMPDDLETPVIADWRQRSMTEDIISLNEFYARHHYLGCCCPVVFRQERTKHTNREHGRIYALGAKSYQRRKDRTNILIDGGATGEVDISASHLTAYLAMKGFQLRCKLPFSISLDDLGDLYGIEGFPRHVIKIAVMLILGKGSIHGVHSWYQAEDYPEECNRYDIQEVIAAIVRRYSILREITPQDQATIVFKESQAVLATVLALKERNVVALPTHDSILVPLHALDMTRDLLMENYKKEFGAVPKVKTKEGTLGSLASLRSRPPSAVTTIDEIISDLLREATYRPVTKSRKKEELLLSSTHTHNHILCNSPNDDSLRVFVTHRKPLTNAEHQQRWRQRQKETRLPRKSPMSDVERQRLCRQRNQEKKLEKKQMEAEGLMPSEARHLSA
jgi:hypothetical protein